MTVIALRQSLVTLVLGTTLTARAQTPVPAQPAQAAPPAPPDAAQMPPAYAPPPVYAPPAPTFVYVKPAPPPPPPEPKVGVHLHDGFYLRMSFGIGPGQGTFKNTVQGFAPDEYEILGAWSTFRRHGGRLARTWIGNRWGFRRPYDY